jgi:hypothetical protein
MPHMKTPPPKTTRVSVPVTPEVLAKFQRFSEASGLSLGKSIGDWLKDTVAGLDAMTEILESHKRKPAEAIAKLHGLSATLQAVSEEAMQNMRKPPRREGAPLAGEGRAAEAMRAAAQSPRLVIRGGNSPKTGKGSRP